MHYLVRKQLSPITRFADWNDAAWRNADTLELAHFRPEGSDHRPIVSARLLYDTAGIHGIFQVHDRFVRSVQTQYDSPVCRDSCVEFFVQPKPDRGYFNLEMNCGGAFLCWHITDPTRTADIFKQYTRLPWNIAQSIKIQTSMPPVVNPQITDPVTWTSQFFLPFSLLETAVGSLGKIPGQTWRANFYKCGDETSHPHWASWSPVDELNFHLPRCFGNIHFE